MKVQVIILCPIEEEYNVVRDYFRFNYTSVRAKSGTYYNIAPLYSNYGKIHVGFRWTGKGHTSISLATTKALTDFQPQLIILLGTAGGIYKVKIGDVVIADQSYHYDYGKVLDQHTASEPISEKADHHLIDMIRHHYHAWLKKAQVQGIKIWIAPMASGDKTITSTQQYIYKQLRKRFVRSIAVDMEAFAFQKSINEANYAVKGLNIRGVADMLTDKAIANQQGSKALATKNALAVAVPMITELVYPSLNRRKLVLFVSPVIVMVLSLIIYQAISAPDNQEESISSNKTEVPPVLINSTGIDTSSSSVSFFSDNKPTEIQPKLPSYLPEKTQERVEVKDIIKEEEATITIDYPEDTILETPIITDSIFSEPTEIVKIPTVKYKIILFNEDQESLKNFNLSFKNQIIYEDQGYYYLPIGNGQLNIFTQDKKYEKNIRVTPKEDLPKLIIINYKDLVSKNPLDSNL